MKAFKEYIHSIPAYLDFFFHLSKMFVKTSAELRKQAKKSFPKTPFDVIRISFLRPIFLVKEDKFSVKPEHYHGWTFTLHHSPHRHKS